MTPLSLEEEGSTSTEDKATRQVPCCETSGQYVVNFWDRLQLQWQNICDMCGCIFCFEIRSDEDLPIHVNWSTMMNTGLFMTNVWNANTVVRIMTNIY